MASANPATAPVTSAVGWSDTAKTVPDVPSEMATSPSTSPSPSAAAMLSPVPGPTRTSPQVPAAVAGPSTVGATEGSSPTRSRTSSEYWPVAGDQ